MTDGVKALGMKGCVDGNVHEAYKLEHYPSRPCFDCVLDLAAG